MTARLAYKKKLCSIVRLRKVKVFGTRLVVPVVIIEHIYPIFVELTIATSACACNQPGLCRRTVKSFSAKGLLARQVRTGLGPCRRYLRNFTTIEGARGTWRNHEV